MKVASFNVNSLRARLPLVLEWLSTHEPDLLCVQETKVQDSDFPGDAFDKIGYKYTFKGQKSYNGVAIFSKRQPEDVTFGLQSEPKDEARLIKAKIQGLMVVNTYVPQGYLTDSEKFEYKLNWFRRLGRYFKKDFKPTEPILWVGDINVAPQPMDVYDPEMLANHVCFHPEARKALEQVVKWGFVDVFRKHCTEAGQYTFWDYRLRNSFKHNLGWRIDHIMATKPLAEKSTACYIDKQPREADRPSDHTPMVGEFAL